MKPNAEQKKAIEYFEGPLLVLAGPGTGKTQLLSEKVAYILRNLDAQPENILCMTFTESGAMNMRERLKSIIGPAGARVRVGTYHAFGKDILKQYEQYSDSYPRRLDEQVDELRQFKIVKQIQQELPGDDILQKDNVKDIIGVISGAKAAGLSAEDLAKIAQQNIEDSRVLSAQIASLLENIVPRKYEESLEQAYQPIYELLQRYGEEAPLITQKIERSIGELARSLKKALLEANDLESIKPLSKWKDDHFDKNDRGEYVLNDGIKNKKLASIAVVMQKYTEMLHKNGWYDFDDMIHEAAKVLKKDAGFRATLSERYQFILLDEFQDTNPAQFAIIKELTDYEKPLIMAVGDDDQAIYEFQGALSTNLTDFQRHYDANVIALTRNYRSTQEILDFSRQIISQATDRFADKELIANRGDLPESQIYRYEFLSSELEYGFVANKIAELVASGVPQNEIAVIACKHRFFMPLLPFLKAHPDLKIAYEKRDNLFEDKQIHQILTICQYVYELANEKRVDTNILEVLSYPFWGLSDIEVVRLVGEARRKKTAIFDEIVGVDSAEEGKAGLTGDEVDLAGDGTKKVATGAAKVAEVGRFLASLTVASFTEPLEVFLSYLIGETELNGYTSPFLEYYTAQGEFERFRLYENLAVLKGKLQQYFGNKKLRLADLIEMVRDYEEASMALTVSSPYRDAAEAVQILTAHKSKGLEFRYVFILGADHNAWGKGKGNNDMLALPDNLKQIRHTGVTDGERLRVLYVALTRARDTLFITNSRRNFEEKALERLEYLEEYENEKKEVVSPFLPTKLVHEIGEVEAKQEILEDLRCWFMPYVQAEPEMREIYRTKMQNFKMSATALTSFIDIVYSGPQEFFKTHILPTEYTPATESQVFGNLIHTVFEAVTNRGLQEDKAIELFQEELETQDLPSVVKRKLLEKGLKDLQINLREFADVLSTGRAEVDLAPEHLTVEGVPVTGKIDHLAIDDTAKTIEIYDFKTGKYRKSGWQKEKTLYKYMLQLEFYKLLLERSAKYKDYRVTKAWILFVTPDNDGRVYRREYEFQAQDDLRLVELIQAVYSLVVSLRFIDDEELFVAPNEKLGVKEIQEFIELILAKS